MTEQQEGTCQFPMRLANPCGRRLYDGDKCVCHSDKDGRLEEFRSEVVAVLNNPDARILDFSGFVFPHAFDLVPEYEKPVYFDKAVFLGLAQFLGAEFESGASFVETEFHGYAQFQRAKLRGGGDFTKATFCESADFRNAHFGQLRDKQPSMTKTQFGLTTFRGDGDFTDADFDGIVDFIRCTFKGKACFQLIDVEGNMSFNSIGFEGLTEFDGLVIEQDAWLTFDGGAVDQESEVMFGEETGFTALRLHQPKQLRFRKVDLSNCMFLETDLSDVEFINVVWGHTYRWPGWALARLPILGTIVKRLRWYLHKAIGDEVLQGRPFVPYSQLADLYQQLQRNYITGYRYGEAGEFYVGEQEMLRRNKGRVRQHASLNNMYRLVSLYGESATLPLFWLICTLTLFPFYFIVDGIWLAEGISTNYALSWSGEFLFFTTDYWSAFAKNLLFVTFNRSDVAVCLTETYQQVIVAAETIWVVVLVTFFVLALRRRFRRKSF